MGVGVAVKFNQLLEVRVTEGISCRYSLAWNEL